MRWPRTRGAETCTTCGAQLDRGAAWCGGCGARVGADTSAVTGAAQAPPPPTGPDRTRLVTVLALGAVLVAVAVAVAVRTPPPVPLLGTPAGASGLSASGPPPTGLRLAWSLPLADRGSPGRSVRSVALVVRGDRVAVEGGVIDLERGDVVAPVPPVGAVGADGTGVLRVDEAVVRIDVLDGSVLGRTPLPDDGGPSSRPALRTGSVTVLTDWRDDEATTVLLRDDAEVLARHPGRPVLDLDRVIDDPAAVPLRQGPGVDAAVVLVGTTGDDVLAEFPGGTPQVVDVVGDRALVATIVSGDVDAPGTGVLWSLRLLDATDGRTLWQTRIISVVAPRLLGRVGDGGAVVVTRSGSEVGVHRIEEAPSATVEVLSQLRTNVLRRGPGFSDTFAASVSSMLRAVALDGDVVVLHDGVAGQVRAVGTDGSELWRRPAPAAAAVAATGGVVAVVPLLPDEPVRLLRTGDGADVATVAHLGARPDAAQAPVAVLDRDLALARRFAPGRLELPVASATWLDLVTGERRDVEEVLLDRTRVEEQVSGGWRLVGVTPDVGTGRAEPVVLRDIGRDVVQLLVPGAGFRSVDLDLPDEGDVASYLAQVVGTTATHVALRTDSFDGPTAAVTHVVDRTTWGSVHLPGVVGFALRDDLLLGVVPDEQGTPRLLVGHDPTTGHQRWRAPAPPFGMGLADAFDDALLLRAAPVRVDAVRLADGGVAWRYDATVALEGRVVLGPSHAVVATVTGAVLALDRGDGAQVWRRAIGARATAMTGAGDHVLVGTADGQVVHLDAGGREVERLAVGTGPVTAVVALGDTVVAVVDGRAVGLRADGSGVARRDEVDLP